MRWVLECLGGMQQVVRIPAIPAVVKCVVTFLLSSRRWLERDGVPSHLRLRARSKNRSSAANDLEAAEKNSRGSAVFPKSLTLIGLFDKAIRFALVPRATKLAALTRFGCSVFRYRGLPKVRRELYPAATGRAVRQFAKTIKTTLPRACHFRSPTIRETNVDQKFGLRSWRHADTPLEMPRCLSN